MATDIGKLDTFPKLLMHHALVRGARPAIREKDLGIWQSHTWQDYFAQAQLIALGLALIFGVMRVINIAHGPLLMLGAYTTFFLHSLFGLNPYLSVPVTMAVLFVVGVVLQRTLVFRVVDAPELSSLLLTFGISIGLVNLAQLAFTSDLRAVEYLTGSFPLGPFAVSKPRLVAFVFAAFGAFLASGLAGRDLGVYEALLPLGAETPAFDRFEDGMLAAREGGQPVFLEFTGFT